MFIAFNKPEPGRSDLTIYNFLLDIFRSCQEESEVVGTIYKWKDAPFTNELNKIVNDKNLNLTLFAGWPLEEYETASDYTGVIKNFLDAHGGLYFNDSDGMMNHNKIILFKEVNLECLKQSQTFIYDDAYRDRVSNISPWIYISSANVGENNKHNTSILVPITNEIYGTVKSYILKIQRGYQGHDVSHTYATYEWFDKFKLYLFPRSSGQDTLLGVLKNVKYYDHRTREHCRICIVTPRWTKGRLNLAKAAKQIHANGAGVDVLTRSVGQGEMSPEIYRQLRYNIFSLLSFGKGNISSLSHERASEGVNIHTKMMLIDGPYKSGDGYTMQKNVWIGTPNLTGPAIKSHWETLLKISNHLAFKDFITNFNFLQEERAKLDSMYALARSLGIRT